MRGRNLLALLNAIDKTFPKIEISPYGTALDNEVLEYLAEHGMESGETLREKRPGFAFAMSILAFI